MTNDKIPIETIERLHHEQASDSDIKKFCLELSSGVVNRQWTILDIVESLEDFLTSTDLSRHNAGLHILGNVVESLPADFLGEKEVEFIAEFFCGQIKQHHSLITAALKGLVALVKNPHLPVHSLHGVTSTLFHNVVWQTQTLTDRMVFYVILQFVIFNRLEDYKTTSSEFLFNIISSVDGERDPRNLLLMFSFLPKLYSDVPLGPLAEDAFEVVACYFPIDFHSQTTEPGSVTREDLVSALNPCLLAHPDFAELCLSLVQEKLESSLKSAKIDSYNLLTAAAEVWPPQVIGAHLEALWRTAKSDVLPPRDAQTAEAAVRALQAIVRTTEEPYLSSSLNSIMSSCDVFLSDVQLSMFEPSFRLLLSVMHTNLPVCSIISQKLLPKLIALLKVTQEISRNLVIDKLTAFIEVCLQMSPNLDLGGEVWKELVACSAASPQAYSALSPAATHIDVECRLQLYHNIVTHLTSSQASSRSVCIKCLQAMAMVYEDEVEEHILKEMCLQGEGKELTQVQNAFETVCSLGVVERFHPAIDQLFTQLVSRGGPYLTLATSCLRNLLETEDRRYNKTLFRFLFSQSSVLRTLLSLPVEGDDLLNSATVVRILVASQDPSEQARCVPSHVEKLLLHSNQTHKMVYLEAILGPLWPQVIVLSPEDIKAHVMPVIKGSSESDLCCTSALCLLASIINKSSDDDVLELVSQSMSNCSENRMTVLCTYVTKALVLRGHPQMELWIDKLLALLDSEVEAVAEAAADGFHLMVQESAVSLTQLSHCVVKLLYRQHLFYIVLPRLVVSAGRLQHLKALAYLLQAVPHTVYMSRIKEVMPLLVKSLDIDSETLLLTVLTTLTHILSAKDSLLQDHVDTFIPRFLHLSRHSLFMQVRIAALKCLGSCLKFSPILLLPHKQQVTTELVYCLDDKKRLVRREAARTRSKWYLLGAPTPD